MFLSDPKFQIPLNLCEWVGFDTLCALENNALNVNSHLLSTCSVLISKSTENHLKVSKDTQDIPSLSVFPHMSFPETQVFPVRCWQN